jgi:hypothetical protein
MLSFPATPQRPTIGGSKMLKILTIALALGAFATACVATQAEAQFGLCIKNNPKDNLPCTVTAQNWQQVKPRSR